MGGASFEIGGPVSTEVSRLLEPGGELLVVVLLELIEESKLGEEGWISNGAHDDVVVDAMTQGI